MVKLITSNALDDMNELLNNTKENFRMICPFIGKNIAIRLSQIISQNKIKSTIITRFSRSDFYKRVSSLDGLLSLEESGCKIKAVRNLHTKLYLFDNDAMILGSSNFTNGGLVSNVELNILIKDERSVINQGIAYFNEINACISEEFFITKKMIQDEMKVLEPLMDDSSLQFMENFDRGQKIGPKKRNDIIEEMFSIYSDTIDLEPTAWIKFEGYSDSKRTPNDDPISITLDSNNYYRTYFPKKKKPTGFKDGDIIFIAKNSWDKNGEPSPMIFGYGFTKKFKEENIVSNEEKEQNPVFKRWPYFINVENFRFIRTTLKDGISLLDLYKDIGSDTFPTSQKRTYEELKQIHKQKDKLRITEKAKDYLLQKLNAII